MNMKSGRRKFQRMRKLLAKPGFSDKWVVDNFLKLTFWKTICFTQLVDSEYKLTSGKISRHIWMALLCTFLNQHDNI
ncbi:hypothetical protein Lalb_Chr14g0375731 [Lupinus albus]|uniref:Uncharacterized protein n=1 Tax=Lupinus albus TaxID=3870 RepID=A0A6A4PGX3_LUPAL|nr:hypothetical protein Lalb_Chr14g0375731 [Lupinus albus]